MQNSLSRRNLLKSTAAAPAAWYLLSQSTETVSADSGDDWPAFQYDAANTGYNPSAEGPTGELVERWSFETLGEVVSSPIVVNDTVYVGSKDGKVYALDAETGDKEWEYDTGADIQSSPASDGTTLYIGNQEGTVFAISIDGIEEWTTDFDGPVSDALSVVDGRLFVPVREVGSLVALDASSGVEEWRSDWDSYAFHAKPAVVDDVVYSVDNSESYEMRARDFGDGEHLIGYRTGGNLRSQISQNNNTIYLIDNDKIFSVNTIEYESRWNFDFQEPIYNDVEKASLTVRGRTLYVAASTASSGYVLSLDDVTGERQWRVELPASTVSSLVLAGDRVYIGCNDGNVYSFDESDGSEVSAFETGAPVNSTAAVSGGALFIGSDDGYVYAIEDIPPNEDPTAAFDYSPSPVVAGREVEFDASKSTDPDGSIESYRWDLTGNGAISARGETTTTTFESSGKQEITLTVTDDRGATASASQTVRVNQAPEPAFTHSPLVPNVNQSVSFDASESTDSDGDIDRFEWDFDNDGSLEATGEQVSHTFTEGGEQLVTLTVADSDGTVQSVSQTVPVNTAPTAAFGISPEQPGAGQTVTFDASGSSDSDGGIQSYRWYLDDDDLTDAIGETMTTQYDEPGEKTVALTVVDANGLTHSIQRSFTVVEAPPESQTDQSGSEENDSQANDSQANDSQENSSEDGSGPGFGVGGALAGLGGAGYLLKRRLSTEDEES